MTSYQTSTTSPSCRYTRSRAIWLLPTSKTKKSLQFLDSRNQARTLTPLFPTPASQKPLNRCRDLSKPNFLLQATSSPTLSRRRETHKEPNRQIPRPCIFPAPRIINLCSAPASCPNSSNNPVPSPSSTDFGSLDCDPQKNITPDAAIKHEYEGELPAQIQSRSNFRIPQIGRAHV